MGDLANAGKCLSVISLEVNVADLVQLGIHPIQNAHAAREHWRVVNRKRQAWKRVHKATVFFLLENGISN